MSTRGGASWWWSTHGKNYCHNSYRFLSRREPAQKRLFKLLEHFLPHTLKKGFNLEKSTVRFFSSVFGSVRFSVRFADLRTDTFFELICGLIYSVQTVQKSANRNKNRIEANRKPRDTDEPKVLGANSSRQFSNSLTEPKTEQKKTEYWDVNQSFSI